MKMRTVPAVLALLTLSGTALAAEPFFQLSLLSSDIKGELSSSELDDIIGAIDLATDIGFDSELNFELAGGVTLGAHRIKAGYGRLQHEVERSLEDFDFEDVEFDASASFRNRLSWLEAEYSWAPINLELARLELLGGVRFYDYEATISGRVSSPVGEFEQTETLEQTGPVPHFGGYLSLRPLPLLSLRGGVKLFFVSLGDDSGSTYDVEIAGGLRLQQFEVGLGYRRFDIEIALDDSDAVINPEYRSLEIYFRFGR